MISRVFFVSCILAFLLVSCQANATTLQATIDSQVIVAVAATGAAAATATPQSTYTPYPTYTPQATQTPYATYTPLPTHTPFPTSTLPPTETLEPTPTHTATAAPQAAAAAIVPPPASAAGDVQSQVLAAIDSFVSDIDSYLGNVQPRWTGNQYTGFKVNHIVRCAGVVSAYTHALTTAVTLDVAQAPANVQNAYTSYRNALPVYENAGRVWAEICQAALASGEEKIISNLDANQIFEQMNPLKNALNSVANELRTP